MPLLKFKYPWIFTKTLNPAKDIPLFTHAHLFVTQCTRFSLFGHFATHLQAKYKTPLQAIHKMRLSNLLYFAMFPRRLRAKKKTIFDYYVYGKMVTFTLLILRNICLISPRFPLSFIFMARCIVFSSIFKILRMDVWQNFSPQASE